MSECKRINISGSQFLNGAPAGIDATDCSHVSITGCTIHDTRPKPIAKHAIQFTGNGRGNLIATNTIGKTTGKAIEAKGARAEGNEIESD